MRDPHLGAETPLPPSTNASLYSVGANAVIVNTATPQAIAHAVLYLIAHPEGRRAIGEAGRETVRRHFTVDRQMRRYAALYETMFAAAQSKMRL